MGETESPLLIDYFLLYLVFVNRVSINVYVRIEKIHSKPKNLLSTCVYII